jgi:hypothetical protein
MKQLTLYCSRDLEDRVISALDRADVHGFVRVAEATGNKFLPAGEVPRTMTWEASLIVVPVVPPEKVERIVRELKEYAGSCEIEPCLHVTVSSVDEAL